MVFKRGTMCPRATGAPKKLGLDRVKPEKNVQKIYIITKYFSLFSAILFPENGKRITKVYGGSSSKFEVRTKVSFRTIKFKEKVKKV